MVLAKAEGSLVILFRNFVALIVVMSVLSMPAHAGEPTKDAIDAMEAFFASGTANDPFYEFTNRPCFVEHMCASGPIGRDPECETNLGNCLASVYQPETPFQPLYDQTCPALFDQLTSQQHQLIAAPKACETPPKAAAVRPTMTAAEARCIGENYCKNPIDSGYDQTCMDSLTRCTTDMTDLDGAERSECRDYRPFALRRDPPWLRAAGSGTCSIEMATPTLWGSSPAQGIDWNNPPQTWQEQVEQAQPQSDDEFIEDDLPF